MCERSNVLFLNCLGLSVSHWINFHRFLVGTHHYPLSIYCQWLKSSFTFALSDLKWNKMSNILMHEPNSVQEEKPALVIRASDSLLAQMIIYLWHARTSSAKLLHYLRRSFSCLEIKKWIIWSENVFFFIEVKLFQSGKMNYSFFTLNLICGIIEVVCHIRS